MPSAKDVAAFISAEMPQEKLRPMKLQKLVYYSQVWSLIWDNEPIFRESVKAWDDGPVIPELWHALKRGETGDASRLSPEQVRTVREVLSFYGQFSGDELSQLTHREFPWRKTRESAPQDRSPLIPHEAMAAFYRGVAEPGQKKIPESLRLGLSFLKDMAEDEACLATDPDAGEVMDLDEFERRLATTGADPGAAA